MAELSAIYSTALFDLFMEMLAGMPDEASRKDVENHYYAQAVFLRDTLKDAEFQQVLIHPHISVTEKQTMLKEALTGNVYPDLIGFLSLAILKNREPFILPALERLVTAVERYQRKTTAKVISAESLNETQAEALRSMLAQKLNKQVELEMSVDPTVIGGVNIYVDGYFIDRTIKRKLSEMKENVKINTALLAQAAK